MKIKRTICLLCAVTTIFTLGLTACGSSDSSSDGTAASQSATTETKDVVAIADKLASDITYVDQLNELDAGMYEKLYSVTSDMYVSGKIYIGSGGATAEEIACFEAKDSAGADKLEEAINARIETLKTTFKDYHPEELTKINDPVVVKQGNYVFMCLSDDNDKAKEIIG